VRLALLSPKGGGERSDSVEPQERSWDETSPVGYLVKQDVEVVRNGEDGPCRRVEPPGYTGARYCRAL
jgi:hypothetical protein